MDRYYGKPYYIGLVCLATGLYTFLHAAIAHVAKVEGAIYAFIAIGSILAFIGIVLVLYAYLVVNRRELRPVRRFFRCISCNRNVSSDVIEQEMRDIEQTPTDTAMTPVGQGTTDETPTEQRSSPETPTERESASGQQAIAEVVMEPAVEQTVEPAGVESNA